MSSEMFALVVMLQAVGDSCVQRAACFQEQLQGALHQHYHRERQHGRLLRPSMMRRNKEPESAAVTLTLFFECLLKSAQ